VPLPRYDSPDWDEAPLLYRFLYRTIRRPIRAVFRVNARGIQRIPDEGGVVLAMNHFSWIDPLVIGDVSPRPIYFLAKKELFENRLLRRVLENLNQIEVDREAGGNEEALRRAREKLEAGGVVGVYPEGTRSNYGNLLRPKRGVARLALQTGCPVVPVALLTHHLWPKGPMVPDLGERVYVNVGESIDYGRKEEAARDREQTQQIADEIMGEVEDLLEEAEAAYQDGERWEW
jgi:1-acyl-sn-glycerol-3-phosphate acyltransferase